MSTRDRSIDRLVACIWHHLTPFSDHGLVLNLASFKASTRDCSRPAVYYSSIEAFPPELNMSRMFCFFNYVQYGWGVRKSRTALILTRACFLPQGKHKCGVSQEPARWTHLKLITVGIKRYPGRSPPICTELLLRSDMAVVLPEDLWADGTVTGRWVDGVDANFRRSGHVHKVVEGDALDKAAVLTIIQVSAGQNGLHTDAVAAGPATAKKDVIRWIWKREEKSD